MSLFAKKPDIHNVCRLVRFLEQMKQWWLKDSLLFSADKTVAEIDPKIHSYDIHKYSFNEQVSLISVSGLCVCVRNIQMKLNGFK